MDNEDILYIIELLGNKHDELEDDLVDDLCEEISTFEDDLIYELTIDVIKLGKWQILECILENNEFTEKQIDDFKQTLEDYVNYNDNYYDIRHNNGEKMEILIDETETDPTNWMKSVKKSKIFRK